MAKSCSCIHTRATTSNSSCESHTSTTGLATSGVDATSTFRHCLGMCGVCHSPPDVKAQLPSCKTISNSHLSCHDPSPTKAHVHRSNLFMSTYGATHEETKRINKQNNCDAYHREANAQRKTYQALPSPMYKEECANAQADFDLNHKNRTAATNPLDLRTRIPEIPNKPPSTSLQGQGEGYGAFCFNFYKEKYKHEENWRFKDHSNNSNILSWSKPENPVLGPSFLEEKTSGAPSVSSGSAGPKQKFQFTKVTPRRMTKTHEKEKVTAKRITKTYTTEMPSRVQSWSKPEKPVSGPSFLKEKRSGAPSVPGTAGPKQKFQFTKVTPRRMTKTYTTGMPSRVTTRYDTKKVTPSRNTTGDGTERVTTGKITKGYLKEKIATLTPTFRAHGKVVDLWDWSDDKQTSLETDRSLRDYTPQVKTNVPKLAVGKEGVTCTPVTNVRTSQPAHQKPDIKILKNYSSTSLVDIKDSRGDSLVSTSFMPYKGGYRYSFLSDQGKFRIGKNGQVDQGNSISRRGALPENNMSLDIKYGQVDQGNIMRRGAVPENNISHDIKYGQGNQGNIMRRGALPENNIKHDIKYGQVNQGNIMRRGAVPENNISHDIKYGQVDQGNRLRRGALPENNISHDSKTSSSTSRDSGPHILVPDATQQDSTVKVVQKESWFIKNRPTFKNVALTSMKANSLYQSMKK